MYHETMRGIRSLKGWLHIPDMETAAANSNVNLFAGPELQSAGKVSVSMSTNEWLCKKLSKLNVTLVEGYPSCSSEASGLLKDQSIRSEKSQSLWYGLHTNQKTSGVLTPPNLTASTAE